MQTQTPYQPADGVNLDLGAVSISDLLVVASGPDAPGQVVGMILNKGTAAQPLTISTPGGSPSKVSIPPGSPRQLDAAPGAVVLTKTGAAPGGLVTMTLSTPSTGPTTASVPVLAPTLYYSTITPRVPAVPGTTPSTPGPLPSTANTGGKVVPEGNSHQDRP